MIDKMTTLRVRKSTIKRLEALKIHPRQSLEEIIIKVLDTLSNDEGEKHGK